MDQSKRVATTPPCEGHSSLGVQLQRMRVVRRVSRLEGVVAVLRGRLAEHGRLHGTPPGPLAGAVADFEAELAEMRLWLQRLDGEIAAAATQRS